MKRKCFAPLMVLAALGVGPVAGAPSPSAVPGIPPFKLGRPDPSTNEWVNAAWTANDRRYLDASERIQKELKRTAPQQVLAAYRVNAQAHPADPFRQFQWAFAAVWEAQLVPRDQFTYRPALRVLQGVNPGNVRAYSRLQYLMTLMLEANKAHPDIERVGERVLAINPADWFVRRQMIFDLCNGTNVHKAVQLATAWTANDPRNPMAHATLAFAYQNLWFRDKSAATKAKAIGEYQHFIALAPPTDPFRARAIYLVGVLEKER